MPRVSWRKFSPPSLPTADDSPLNFLTSFFARRFCTRFPPVDGSVNSRPRWQIHLRSNQRRPLRIFRWIVCSLAVATWDPSRANAPTLLDNASTASLVSLPAASRRSASKKSGASRNSCQPFSRHSVRGHVEAGDVPMKVYVYKATATCRAWIPCEVSRRSPLAGWELGRGR